uniref:Uncharacterized protein n=1 Tax=Anguilla anguilla TaxID=7936 RepID=A0A0E9W0C5_ANGAN
MEFSKSSQK